MTRPDFSPLRWDELIDSNGILHRRNEPASAYRDRWELEATEDHVRSAIAASPEEGDELERLTSKVSSLWGHFPRDFRAGTVLEIGSGYGRIPLFLTARRGLTFDTYVAVDISEAMLRRLLEYCERFEMSRHSSLHALRLSADDLPLDDDSVDLVLSSAVFLHMGKCYVLSCLAEVARVLRPGGSFVFDASFPNARNPANLIFRLKPKRLRGPNYLKYWTRAEVARALSSSGLASKAGPVTVAPSGCALLPKRVLGISIPLARRLNARLERARVAPVLLATSFSTFSGVMPE